MKHSMNSMKKWMAWILSIVMMLSVLPMNVLAEEFPGENSSDENAQENPSDAQNPGNPSEEESGEGQETQNQYTCVEIDGYVLQNSETSELLYLERNWELDLWMTYCGDYENDIAGTYFLRGNMRMMNSQGEDYWTGWERTDITVTLTQNDCWVVLENILPAEISADLNIRVINSARRDESDNAQGELAPYDMTAFSIYPQSENGNEGTLYWDKSEKECTYLVWNKWQGIRKYAGEGNERFDISGDHASILVLNPNDTSTEYGVEWIRRGESSDICFQGEGEEVYNTWTEAFPWRESFGGIMMGSPIASVVLNNTTYYLETTGTVSGEGTINLTTDPAYSSNRLYWPEGVPAYVSITDRGEYKLSWSVRKRVMIDGRYETDIDKFTGEIWGGMVLLIDAERSISVECDGMYWGLAAGTEWKTSKVIPMEQMNSSEIVPLTLPRGKYTLGLAFDNTGKLYLNVQSDYAYSLMNAENECLVLDIRECRNVYLEEGTYSLNGWRVIRDENGERIENAFHGTITIVESGYYMFETEQLGDEWFSEDDWQVIPVKIETASLGQQNGTVDNCENDRYIFEASVSDYYSVSYNFMNDNGHFEMWAPEEHYDEWWTREQTHGFYLGAGQSVTIACGDSGNLYNEYSFTITQGHTHEFGWFEGPDGTKVRCHICQEEVVAILYSSGNAEEYYFDANEAVERFADIFDQDYSDITLELFQSATVERDLVITNNSYDRKWRYLDIKNDAVLTIDGSIRVEGNVSFELRDDNRDGTLIVIQGITLQGDERYQFPDVMISLGVQADLNLQQNGIYFRGDGYHRGSVSMGNVWGSIDGSFTFYYDPSPFFYIDDRMVRVQGTDEYGEYWSFIERVCDIFDINGEVIFDDYSMSAGGSSHYCDWTLDHMVDNFGITYYATNRHWENGAWIVELTQDETLADRSLTVHAPDTIHFREENGVYRFIVTPASHIYEWRNYGDWEQWSWYDHAVGLDDWYDRYFSSEEWFSVTRRIMNADNQMEEELQMMLVDDQGNSMEGTILSEGDYRLIPNGGGSWPTRFQVEEGTANLRIIENEQGEWILHIEKRLEWNIDIPERGQINKYNPFLTIDQDYTISNVNINGSYYNLCSGFMGDSGMIGLTFDWTGCELTFRKTTSWDQPFDEYHFWIVKTMDGSYALGYEKLGMIHLNEMEIPFGAVSCLDVYEELPLNIEYQGIPYGIQPVEGRLLPGEYVLEPLVEGSTAVMPVLTPGGSGKMVVSFGYDQSGSMVLRLRGGYNYYLVDQNGAKIMDLGDEDTLAIAENIAQGTYLVMVEWENERGNIVTEYTGRDVMISEDGTYGIQLRNARAEWWYGEMSPMLLGIENLELGENSRQIWDPSCYALYQYTAQKDEFHTFDIHYNDDMTAVLQTPNLYVVTGFGGQRIIGGYLHEGETAYIAVKPHYPASREYSITVYDVCLHSDMDEDSICDICGAAMVAKVIQWGEHGPVEKVYTSMEEAVNALVDAQTESTTLSLLGNGGHYTLNDELILGEKEGQFRNYIIELNGNNLVIDGGITLDKSRLDIIDSAEQMGNLFADITIISDEFMSITGDMNRGEVVVENAGLHGIIDFQGTAYEMEEGPENIPAILRLEYQGFFYGTLTGEYGVIQMEDGGTIDAVFATENCEYLFNGGCVLSELDGMDGTNHYHFNMTRFRYNPESLIEKDWQVSVAENINGINWYVVVPQCGNAADGLIPGIREVCENAVNDGMIPITYASPSYNRQGMTTGFAGVVSLTLNGSVQEFEDHVYSAVTATPEWLIGEMMMNNVGLNIDPQGQLDLAGGTLTLQYAMTIDAYSASEDADTFGYTLGVTVRASAVYTDANGQVTTISTSEKVGVLPENITVKAAIPAALAEAPLGVSIIHLSTDGNDLRAVYDAQIEVIDGVSYAVFNNCAGMYDFIVCVNTKEIYELDENGQMITPSDITFDYIGQKAVLDLTIGETEDTDEVVYIVYMEDFEVAGFEMTEDGRPMVISENVGETDAILAAFVNEILVATRRIHVSAEQNVPQMHGYSLTLDGKIGLNYYLTIPGNVMDELSDEAYVVLSHNTEIDDVIQLRDARHSGDLYKFTVYVSAKEMHDEVVLHLFDQDDEIVVYSSYGEPCEHGVPFSVAEYRQLAMERGVDGELMYLMDTMLNYGYTAQMYFGYNTENAEQVKSINSFNFESWKNYDVTDSSMELSYYGSTLLLKDDTIIRHYFRVNGDLSGYSFSCRYGQIQLMQKGSLYYVDVPGVPATELADNIVAQGMNMGTNQFIGLMYGPFNYAYQACKNGSEELRNLMYAMAEYCMASRQYFRFDME